VTIVLKNNIETITDYIDLGPRTTQVMDSIKFNNFFLFNYIIKKYAYKIQCQSKIKHLFKTIITL
jgi:hypothetical protein